MEAKGKAHGVHVHPAIVTPPRIANAGVRRHISLAPGVRALLADGAGMRALEREWSTVDHIPALLRIAVRPVQPCEDVQLALAGSELFLGETLYHMGVEDVVAGRFFHFQDPVGGAAPPPSPGFNGIFAQKSLARFAETDRACFECGESNLLYLPVRLSAQQQQSILLRAGEIARAGHPLGEDGKARSYHALEFNCQHVCLSLIAEQLPGFPTQGQACVVKEQLVEPAANYALGMLSSASEFVSEHPGTAAASLAMGIVGLWAIMRRNTEKARS